MRGASQHWRRPSGAPVRRGAVALAVALAGLLAGLLAASAGAADDALFAAAERGDTETLVRLLDQGSDPNAIDGRGRSPLFLAATAGRADTLSALLERGAYVDLADYDGNTPLVQASAGGHAECVRRLLEAGADPTLESAAGFTPLQHARRARHREVVAILIEAKRRAASGATAARPPPSAGVSRPGRRAAPEKRTYRPGYEKRVAAVIGVNDYVSWPRLTGARPDAEKVAERLRQLGFETVLELYDREATRGAILELLGSRLAGVVGENDLVVIFFAGHGQTETIGRGTREQKRGYIIPADASVEGVFSTAIPMHQLRALTNRLPAKHVFYAMDSCYSGLGFSRALGIVRKDADDYIDKVTSLRSVQMVTAGGEGEEVIERDGEGVFTRSLLDALDGEADANGDGYVTATEIGAYVAPRVTNETGARQSPQSGRLEGEGEIAFEIRANR